MQEFKYKKLGNFITQAIEKKSNTHSYLHTSRRTRKGLKKLVVDIKDHSLGYELRKLAFYLTYKPDSLTWWIAVLFMIGSTFFTVGSAICLYFESSFSSFFINSVFFIGSIFFTSAAYGQYLESINGDITNEEHLREGANEWQWFAYRPHNLGYLASLIQLIGTLMFNLNTFDPFFASLTNMQEELLVWTPNLIGSIFFLIASSLAWLEIFHDKHIKAFKSVTWWIIWINLLGSVFFQISAIASYINIGNGEVLDGTLALQQTLYGAICFFIGAYLLIVEMKESQREE